MRLCEEDVAQIERWCDRLPFDYFCEATRWELEDAVARLLSAARGLVQMLREESPRLWLLFSRVPGPGSFDHGSEELLAYAMEQSRLLTERLSFDGQLQDVTRIIWQVESDYSMGRNACAKVPENEHQTNDPRENHPASSGRQQESEGADKSECASSNKCRSPLIPEESLLSGLPEMASASDLARFLKLDHNPLENALRRYRESHPDCFVRNKTPRIREPKFLYRVKAVWEVIQKQLQKPRRSTSD